MKYQRWYMLTGDGGDTGVEVSDAKRTGFVRIENRATGEAVEVTEGVLEEYLLDIIKKEK